MKAGGLREFRTRATHKHNQVERRLNRHLDERAICPPAIRSCHRAPKLPRDRKRFLPPWMRRSLGLARR